MEYSSVGNHELAACPHCDELFHIIAKTDSDRAESIHTLSEMHRRHLESSPRCQTAQDALPSMKDLQESLGPVFREAAEKREAELDAHPDNGKLGYWHVDGIRHDARCKASSAREAVDKCVADGAVGDWESPTATFIGEELPEVF